MQQTSKPASKVKVVLLWLILVGNIVFWMWFTYRLWGHHNPSPPQEESGPDIVRSVLLLFVGGFFLCLGVAGYLLAVFTNGLTFNFDQPIWAGLKTRMFLANIFVPLLWALGLGLGISAFVSPILLGHGISPGLANILPVMVMVVLLQIAQVWVHVWTPMLRRATTKRLLAQGITPAQMQTARLIGISDPQRSSFKKFSSVLEDIGALWVGPDQLVYWGDNDRFGITREQLWQIERKADAGGTSMLGGITHVILHVKVPDGSERQIRLHPSSGTMGQACKAMDALEAAIVGWHGAAGNSQ